MLYRSIDIITLAAVLSALSTAQPSTPQITLNGEHNNNIPLLLFAELEELSRIVDISYCVGTTGISKPFECASRCDQFPNFELVDTFNTGPLMSDSCGYLVLDHETGRTGRGRVIVVFRGTYSIANTIVDLSTVPQEYVPFPGAPNSTSTTQPAKDGGHRSFWDWFRRPAFLRHKSKAKSTCAPGESCSLQEEQVKCYNCTVHTGFWTSWQNTRQLIIPHLAYLRQKYPDYQLHLVGHSLGGAVAALAGMEFLDLGWGPTVTTFGEPRVGNAGLRDYIDRRFDLKASNSVGDGQRYRRVTHVDDPVPLLPLQEWGYRAHAGEVYISKASLQPGLSDVHLCFGDEDTNCIAGAEVDEAWFNAVAEVPDVSNSISETDMHDELSTHDEEALTGMQKRWGIPIPARYKIWQLFFAHRDYFWRLGLCVPGGDPMDWGRERYDLSDPRDEWREEL